MPGALVHVAAGLLSAALVHLKHFKLEFSLAIFIGNLFPDAIRQGVSAVAQGTLNVMNVKEDRLFNFLAATTNNPANWFTFGFFLLLLITFFYHYHVIKKKKLWEYEELYVFLLLGIITHLIMDALIFEKGPWF